MTTAPPRLEAPPLPETPYVGLVPYGEDDADFFFGRDTETQIVASNLRASRLTILYGPSGVGKTSLVEAGVMHALRGRMLENAAAGRAPYAVCSFRAWRENPLPSLVECIRGAAVEALGGQELPAWGDEDSLVDTLRGWTEHVRTLLVVLDQFEDYFFYHPGESGSRTLADELPLIVNDVNLRVHLLLSVREDAWPKLDRFKARIPRLFGNYIRVRHLSEDAARAAIERPVQRWNDLLPEGAAKYAVDGDLVDRVVEQTATGQLALDGDADGRERTAVESHTVEAPFLQLVMDRVWRATVDAGAHRLTLARLVELGGAATIVESHVRDALDGLTHNEREIASECFRFLVTADGTKVARTAADLAGQRPLTQVTPVLEKLCSNAGGRILRANAAVDDESPSTYELFHDMLTEPILAWRRAFERRAAIRRRIRRGGIVVGLAMLPILAALLAVALVQRSHAVHSANVAGSEATAFTAKDLVSRRLDQALELGLQAYRRNPTVDARSALTLALETAQRDGVSSILRSGVALSVAYSPDGRTLATGGAAGTVRLWSAVDGQPLRSLRAGSPRPVGGVTSLAFSPRTRLLAAGSQDGTITVWSLANESAPQVAKKHNGTVYGLAFSPDGRTLASAGRDGTVRLWNVASGKPTLGQPLLRGANGRVYSVAFDAGGQRLAAAGQDGRVAVWTLAGGKPTSLLEVPRAADDQFLEGVTFSGQTLAAVGQAGLRLWRLSGGTAQPLPAPKGASGILQGVAVDPTGHALAVAGDGQVRVWRTRNGVPAGAPRVLVTDGGTARGVAFSPDGGTLAAPVDNGYYTSTGGFGSVWLWRLATPAQSAALPGSFGPVRSVAFVPPTRSTSLAVAGFDASSNRGVVWLWDLAHSTHRTVFDRAHPFRSVASSASVLVAGDGSGNVWLRHPSGAGQQLRLAAGREPVNSVAFSPRGGRLAEGGDDGTVRVWNVTKPSPPPPTLLRGHLGAVEGVAFSTDGKTLASAGDDGTIRLWDLAGHRTPAVLRGHNGPVNAVAFSPDGKLLASAGADGTVRLWDVRSHAERGQPLLFGAAEVLSVAFSHDGKTLAAGDGRTLASGGNDGNVQLWDVDTGKPLGGPLHESSLVTSVAFSPDGRTLVTGSDDGRVRLWKGILWHDYSDVRARVCALVRGSVPGC